MSNLFPCNLCVLTYSSSSAVTQVFCELIGCYFVRIYVLTLRIADMVSQFAQNEQNMNAVERILVYIDLPREGEATTPNDPPPSWPDRGEVKFKNVNLAYREGLPLVLKGVDFEVKPGEKVNYFLLRAKAFWLTLICRLVSLAELAQASFPNSLRAFPA